MTIPSCALGLFGGAAYFGSLDTDPMKPIWVRSGYKSYHFPESHVILGHRSFYILWRLYRRVHGYGVRIFVYVKITHVKQVWGTLSVPH